MDTDNSGTAPVALLDTLRNAITPQDRLQRTLGNTLVQM